LLFIFLLVGYCQLFASVQADQYNHPGTSTSVHYEGQSTKAIGFVFLFVEEEMANEGDRFSKRLSEPTISIFHFRSYLHDSITLGSHTYSIGRTISSNISERFAYLVFCTFRI
jgi:hypothetical protein